MGLGVEVIFIKLAIRLFVEVLHRRHLQNVEGWYTVYRQPPHTLGTAVRAECRKASPMKLSRSALWQRGILLNGGESANVTSSDGPAQSSGLCPYPIRD